MQDEKIFNNDIGSGSSNSRSMTTESLRDWPKIRAARELNV